MVDPRGTPDSASRVAPLSWRRARRSVALGLLPAMAATLAVAWLTGDVGAAHRDAYRSLAYVPMCASAFAFLSALYSDLLVTPILNARRTRPITLRDTWPGFATRSLPLLAPWALPIIGGAYGIRWGVAYEIWIAVSAVLMLEWLRRRRVRADAVLLEPTPGWMEAYRVRWDGMLTGLWLLAPIMLAFEPNAESVSITMVVALFGYWKVYSQLERDPRLPASTATTAALSAALILCPVLGSRLAGRDPFLGLAVAIVGTAAFVAASERLRRMAISVHARRP